jgi:hypothetical protein
MDGYPESYIHAQDLDGRDDIYSPEYDDSESHKKYNGHTVRNTRSSFTIRDQYITINRGIGGNNTLIDAIFNFSPEHRSLFYSLSSNKRFEDFVREAFNLCIDFKTEYFANNKERVTTFKIPITSTTQTTNRSTNRSANKQITYNIQDSQDYNSDRPRIRMIEYNDVLYPNNKTYSESKSGNLISLNIPNDFNSSHIPKCNINEQVFKPKSQRFKNNVFTYTFNHELSLNCIFLHPSEMQLKYIHGDNFNCKKHCKKNKHFLTLLSKPVGYIIEFELWYRSSNTFNKWIKIDKFNGNTSMFDHRKIYFNETVIKELRIVPTKINESIDKVIIKFIGQKIHDSLDKDTDECVEYIINQYEHNTYNKGYVDIYDTFSFFFGCDCSACMRTKKYGKHGKLHKMIIYEQINDGVAIDRLKKSLIRDRYEEDDYF